MSEKAVYIQTARGREELTALPGSLGPNLKALLGMFDGKSTVEDLQRKLDKVPLDRLLAALQTLVKEGYLEAAASPAASNDLDFASFMSQPTPTPTAAQRQQAEQATLTSMRSLKQAGYFVNIISRSGKPIPPRSGSQYSILIIDGDQANALVLARALVLAQFNVRSASREHEVMAELSKPPPDLILMDVVLPDLVGIEILAKLREHPVFKSVPVIVVTAQAQHDDVVAALVYGANGFMTKPVQTETLLDSVKSVLGIK
ncbi:MAG: response regulator [Burkholderiales bacterium]